MTKLKLSTENIAWMGARCVRNSMEIWTAWSAYLGIF
jgi:hypothetical protein